MRTLSWPLRLSRLLATSALLGAVAAGAGAGTAFAQTGPPGQGAAGGTDASLQAQAQQLASEVTAEGELLDQLDSSYQAAQMRYGQLQAEEWRLRGDVASTEVQVGRARQALKEQALVAYMTGGTPTVGDLPAAPGDDPSVVAAYAEIIAAAQRSVLVSYSSALGRLAGQQAALGSAAGQAAVTLRDIRLDEGRAQAALAQQQGDLSQVKGRLAAAYAQVQAADAQTQAASVRASLAAEGVLPSSQPTGAQAAVPAAGAGAGTLPEPGASTAHTATPPPVTPPAVTAPPVTGAVAPAPVPTTPPTSATQLPAPTSDPTGPAPAQPPPQGSDQPAPGAATAIAYAQAQLGKPYQWGGAGPAAFDCSGLVMMAWAQAGVYFPHLAQDQYDMTERIPLADLLPGDLVFFGTPSDVYHVGIYIGGGEMIDAPSTGQVVSVQSIYWDTLLGGGRVRS